MLSVLSLAWVSAGLESHLATTDGLKQSSSKRKSNKQSKAPGKTKKPRNEEKEILAVVDDEEDLEFDVPALPPSLNLLFSPVPLPQLPVQSTQQLPMPSPSTQQLPVPPLFTLQLPVHPPSKQCHHRPHSSYQYTHNPHSSFQCYHNPHNSYQYIHLCPHNSHHQCL